MPSYITYVPAAQYAYLGGSGAEIPPYTPVLVTTPPHADFTHEY